MSGFALPLLPLGYHGFPVTNELKSIAYSCGVLASYLLLLIFMSLHAVSNPRLALGARLGWIFMNATGWGAVVYFVRYYWGHEGGPPSGDEGLPGE